MQGGHNPGQHDDPTEDGRSQLTFNTVQETVDSFINAALLALFVEIFHCEVGFVYDRHIEKLQ